MKGCNRIACSHRPASTADETKDIQWALEWDRSFGLLHWVVLMDDLIKEKLNLIKSN